MGDEFPASNEYSGLMVVIAVTCCLLPVRDGREVPASDSWSWIVSVFCSKAVVPYSCPMLPVWLEEGERGACYLLLWNGPHCAQEAPPTHVWMSYATSRSADMFTMLVLATKPSLPTWCNACELQHEMYISHVTCTTDMDHHSSCSTNFGLQSFPIDSCTLL